MRCCSPVAVRCLLCVVLCCNVLLFAGCCLLLFVCRLLVGGCVAVCCGRCLLSWAVRWQSRLFGVCCCWLLFNVVSGALNAVRCSLFVFVCWLLFVCRLLVLFLWFVACDACCLRARRFVRCFLRVVCC